MTMGSDQPLLTTRQAADYLGTSVGVIYWYVRKKRLKRVRKSKGRRGGMQYLYEQRDLQQLAEDKERKPQLRGLVDEALARAARAESVSRDLERRLGHLYELLGLQYDQPDLTPAGLHAQHRLAAHMVHPMSLPILPDEALDLARLVYRINEEQLRLLTLTVMDPEPWRVYLQACSIAIQELTKLTGEEARAVLFYLNAAVRSLRNVAFCYVQQQHGHVVADRVVEQCGQPVDEAIAAIIMSPVKTG